MKQPPSPPNTHIRWRKTAAEHNVFEITTTSMSLDSNPKYTHTCNNTHPCEIMLNDKNICPPKPHIRSHAQLSKNESFYVRPPNFSITKSPGLKPAPGLHLLKNGDPCPPRVRMSFANKNICGYCIFHGILPRAEHPRNVR